MSRNGTRDKLGQLDKLFPGYGKIVIKYKRYPIPTKYQ